MMKLSARNQIKGKVTEVIRGQTTGHVDIGNGVTVHCSITNEAIDDLALEAGDDAWAVIKASDVMVAKKTEATSPGRADTRRAGSPAPRPPPAPSCGC